MAWVVAHGPQVREPLPRGSTVFLHDSFEMEDTDLDMWDQLKELPEFSRLKSLCETYEGEILTQICHESSVLCHDDAWDGQFN